jgi:hypothetical protein
VDDNFGGSDLNTSTSIFGVDQKHWPAGKDNRVMARNTTYKGFKKGF